MGAISPVLTGLGGLVSTVNMAQNLATDIRNLGTSPDQARRDELRAQQNLALSQLKQAQSTEMKTLEQQAESDRLKIATDAAASEEARRAALRRAVARQRAQFGAQGIASDAVDGSAQAVLLGLYDESEQERSKREQLDNLRLGAIEEDLSTAKRLNVLQRAQLAERQRLERIAEGY